VSEQDPGDALVTVSLDATVQSIVHRTVLRCARVVLGRVDVDATVRASLGAAILREFGLGESDQ